VQVLYTLRTTPHPRRLRIIADLVREQLPEAPYQVANRASLELVDYGSMRLPDEFTHAPTAVPFSEINCLLAGRGIVLYGGRRYPVQPGFLYLFPAGKTLGSVDNRGVCKGYCHFNLRLHGFDLLQGENPLTVPCPPAEARRWAKVLLSKNILAVKGASLDMLSHFDTALQGVTRRRSRVYARYTDFFSAAERGEALEEVARRYGRSKRSFAAAFKSAFGVTPKQYLLRERLSRVQSRLLQSERTLAEIAEDLGFSDAFYLSRFFKRQTGLTPSEYRNLSQHVL